MDSQQPLCAAFPGDGQTQLLSRKPLESKAGLRVLRLAFYLAVTFLRFFIILNKSAHISTLPCPRNCVAGRGGTGHAARLRGSPLVFLPPALPTTQSSLSQAQLCLEEDVAVYIPAHTCSSVLGLRGSAAVTSDRQ